MMAKGIFSSTTCFQISERPRCAFGVNNVKFFPDAFPVQLFPIGGRK